MRDDQDKKRMHSGSKLLSPKQNWKPNPSGPELCYSQAVPRYPRVFALELPCTSSEKTHLFVCICTCACVNTWTQELKASAGSPACGVATGSELQSTGLHSKCSCQWMISALSPGVWVWSSGVRQWGWCKNNQLHNHREPIKDSLKRRKGAVLFPSASNL